MNNKNKLREKLHHWQNKQKTYYRKDKYHELFIKGE